MYVPGAQWALLLVAVLAGLLAGLLAASRRRTAGVPLVLLAVLAPVGASVVLLQLLGHLGKGLWMDVNASRVANAVAVARGYDIFAAVDEGPLLDFMYGPMFALAYTPAALASTPTGAVWTGLLLSFLFVVGPFAWLAFRASAPPSRQFAAAAVACFGLLCSHDRGLNWVTWYILADAPALAFAAAACACLWNRDAESSPRRLAFAALFAVLSVWSKQIAAPIVLSLPVYVALRDGRESAIRLLGWIAGIGLLVSVAFVACFGFDGLLFNMFQMPANHPWKNVEVGGTRASDLLRSLGRLATNASMSGVVVVALCVGTRQRGEPIREWLREQPWTLLVCVALFMVPMATLGGAKIGGEHNVYTMSTWFLTGAALLGLMQAAASTQPRSRDAAQLVMALVLGLGVGMELGSPVRQAALLTSLGKLGDWRNNPQEQATAFARAHPDEAHFLGNPLVGLYSDRKLYSDLFGRYDRELAGFVPDPGLMRNHAPSRLRYVVVRRDFPWFVKPSKFPGYEEFTQLDKVPELPYHFVWERPVKSSSGAGGEHGARAPHE